MTFYALDWLAKDMTLRDYFAAQALGGLAADYSNEDAARAAYEMADAMISEKNKTPPAWLLPAWLLTDDPTK